jgi:phenylacetate-CoA ligase
LYFQVQRLRVGVSTEMISDATRRLEMPLPSMEKYVSQRLEAVHGPLARSPGWLRDQPLVERSTLRPSVARVHAGGRLHRVEERKTSGSTGTPFSFPKDMEMTAWMDAAMWAVYGWHGVTPGMRQARFWGAPIGRVPAFKRRIMDWALARRRLNAFEIAPERSASFYHALRRFHPSHAYGYPTLIREFVEHCTAAGLDGRELHLRTVICTGELLSPSVRARIGEFFGCPVVNEYGCTESGIVAMECESGTQHLIPVAAFPEVVEPSGAPVRHGETGEVVITDLYGAVLPLLRYRLHDRAQLGPSRGCPCGRELPSIALTEGRVQNFIHTPDRGPVYAAILAYTVPREVARFRAFQRSTHHLHVQIVPGEGFDPESTPLECRQRWTAAVGSAMEVSTEVVDAIPYAASGKLRYFVPLLTDDENEDGTAYPKDPYVHHTRVD